MNYIVLYIKYFTLILGLQVIQYINFYSYIIINSINIIKVYSFIIILHSKKYDNIF